MPLPSDTPNRAIRSVLATLMFVGCTPSGNPVSAPDSLTEDEAQSATGTAAPMNRATPEPASTRPGDSSPPQMQPPEPVHESTATGRPSEFRTLREPLDLNPQRLEAAGIYRLESRRLILLTDRDPDSVRDLPALADRFFDFLETRCGPLRPSRSGEEFQATGCLMVDAERFQTAGLVPTAVVNMKHGDLRGYRFWLRDQQEDYYRRHLLLHEFAHVYMSCDTGLNNIGAGWFMEGAAELFATHAISQGTPDFGILPHTFEGLEGWGRISTIRRQRVDRPAVDVELQSIPPLPSVQFPQGDAARDEARYSWWWALAWMLSHHPDYSTDWTALCHSRGSAEFHTLMNTMQERYGRRLHSDWLLFADSVCEQFDPQRSFPIHLEDGTTRPDRLTLAADAGWQDSGWELQAEETVHISVSGECIPEQTSAPWISEPNGITLEYNQGSPLGQTLAVLVSGDDGWISRRIPVATGRILTAQRNARLWLQINDSAGSRQNNSGDYQVTIQLSAESTGSRSSGQQTD